MKSGREREALLLSWLQEHRGIVYRLARAYTDTTEDQADLVQDMAAQLWRSLPGFRGQCKPVTWVYRVCLHTALGWQRGLAAQKRWIPIASDVIDATASPEPRPGWTHEQEELLERLYESIRQLPAGERSVVLLALEGLSYREIGELTGLTETHVGVSLTRARQKLTVTMKEVRDEL